MLQFDLTRNLPQHRFHFRARLADEPSTTALCGANGSGKSLLLSMLAGVEKPDRGRIVFGDDLFFDATCNLAPDKRHIGYAFQAARLFPHMSVEKNLDYAQRMRKARCDHKERDDVIESLALSHLLARYPSRLSGGEQQRVGLARALLAKPRLLLLDEPLSSMDRRHKRQALEFLHQWLREKSLSCIYVSHDLEEVACIATHALILGTQRHNEERETITHSRVATHAAIEVATTELRTSRDTGASPVAIVPVVVQEQRALDGLWTASFRNNSKARFLLSTHKGEPPAFLRAHECQAPAHITPRITHACITPACITPACITPACITHARIRAEDVLLAERHQPDALRAHLLAFSSSHEGSHTAQISCSQQRLLMQLSAEQAGKLKETGAKTCHVRIRKAQGGIL